MGLSLPWWNLADTLVLGTSGIISYLSASLTGSIFTCNLIVKFPSHKRVILVQFETGPSGGDYHGMDNLHRSIINRNTNLYLLGKER